MLKFCTCSQSTHILYFCMKLEAWNFQGFSPPLLYGARMYLFINFWSYCSYNDVHTYLFLPLLHSMNLTLLFFTLLCFSHLVVSVRDRNDGLFSSPSVCPPSASSDAYRVSFVAFVPCMNGSLQEGGCDPLIYPAIRQAVEDVNSMDTIVRHGVEKSFNISMNMTAIVTKVSVCVGLCKILRYLKSFFHVFSWLLNLLPTVLARSLYVFRHFSLTV